MIRLKSTIGLILLAGVLSSGTACGGPESPESATTPVDPDPRLNEAPPAAKTLQSQCQESLDSVLPEPGSWQNHSPAETTSDVVRCQAKGVFANLDDLPYDTVVWLDVEFRPYLAWEEDVNLPPDQRQDACDVDFVGMNSGSDSEPTKVDDVSVCTWSTTTEEWNATSRWSVFIDHRTIATVSVIANREFQENDDEIPIDAEWIDDIWQSSLDWAITAVDQ